jgi:hypothetical protein
MPEGLSPIEVGKQLHQRHQPPHHPTPATGSNRHRRIVQIAEALLLSLVTIAAAWSGYAAAKWETESHLHGPGRGAVPGRHRQHPSTCPPSAMGSSASARSCCSWPPR